MESTQTAKDSNPAAPISARDYRLANTGKLMVLTRLRGGLPAQDDFCRIRSVETLFPSLWISVRFLDGSIRWFRPEKLRLATADEEKGIAGELSLPGRLP